MKLKNRFSYYLLLSIGNMTIPYTLGVFLVFLFRQAPEFVIVGVFLGLTLIQVMFFVTVTKCGYLKSLLLGTIAFGTTLGIAILMKRVSIIDAVTYQIFSLETTSSKVLRFLALYSFLCLITWELMYCVINTPKTRSCGVDKPRPA